MSIRKIAKLADVSTTTVSRVINNHPYVSTEKRQRVLSIMQDIHYTPNSHAINLSSGKSHTLGLIVPQTRNSCYEQIIEGVLEQALIDRQQVLLLPTYFDSSIEQNYYQLLRDKTLDGIIITSRTQDINFIQSLQSYGPVVVTEKNDSVEVPCVYPDRKQLYDKLFSWLANTYPTLPVYLTVNRPVDLGLSSKLKVDAYTYYFPHLGIEKHLFEGIMEYSDGVSIGKSLFDHNHTPFIVYTNGDDVAAGIVSVGTTLGKKLNQDYFLVGEDNLPYSDLLTFSTVDFRLKEIGKKAVSLLLHEEVIHQRIEAQLIKR